MLYQSYACVILCRCLDAGNIRMQMSRLLVSNLVACSVNNFSCDSDRMSQEFCCVWKVWSSSTKLLFASSCLLSFVFLWYWCHCRGFNATGVLKQHTCSYMDVRECVSPECSLCMQELYTGAKDCNILAWVPVLRSPDVEDEESNGTNKVGNRITCFGDDCEPGGCIIFSSVLYCYSPMTDITSQIVRVISEISTMTPQCFLARSPMLS